MNPYDQPVANPYNVATPTAPTTPFAATPLGVATNTVLGLPKAAVDVGSNIFHSITSSFASIIPTLNSASNAKSGTNAPEELPVPDAATHPIANKAFKVIFGDQPITSLQTQVAQTEQAIKNSPFAQSIGLNRFALPLAFGGVVGGEALNFTPLGGESKVISTLVKEGDANAIAHTLEQMGVHSELIPHFSDSLAQAKTPAEVTDILSNLKNAQGLAQIDEKLAATKQPISNGQYPTIHQGGVIKMVQGEPVDIVDGVDTFIHKGDGGWVVSEASTGRFLSASASKEGAIAKAHFNIDNVGRDNFLRLLEENKLPATSHPEGQLPAETPHPESGTTPTNLEPQSKSALEPSLQELNQSRSTPGESSVPSPSSLPNDFKYVKDEPLNISALKNDKTTTTNIREEYAGVKNAQIARGNQLADELRAMAPKEQEGMFWYKAAKGDTATLEQLLKDPKFEPYHPGIKSALNLSPEAKAALAKGDQYYAEAGQVSKKLGTIGNIRDEYQNRIYTPEPPKDFVQSEMGQGLKQTTSHAKARVFDSEIDAVKGGKTFATTNYADALAIHNEEMARVNTARALMDTMEHGGLGSWVTAGEHAPAGFEQVGNIRKGPQSFYAPKGIAKGLSAIADPDFMRKIDLIRGLQHYQGLVKSVDLAFSFFHHLTFVTQTLSSKRGLTTLAQMVTKGLKMDAPEFTALEQDFIRHDGMTTQVAATQDIMRNLAKGDDNISKLLQLPVGKQINSAIQASNKFLFEKMQRFLKVMTYQKNAASWVAKHPSATNEEVVAAKRGFAKAVNAEFGGLNWQAMGITKSNQSILRTLFLAPDWLTSAGVQVKYAVSDTGTAGNVARMTLAKAVIGGMAITEGINKLMTGHFTDQNPKGHGLEVEVAPNVYVSLIRGAPGELVKFISNAIESGPVQGTARYLEGKLSPIARTGLEFASGVDYNGKSIYQGGKHPTVLSKTFGGLMALLTNISPIPFSFGSVAKEIGSGQATPAGIGATLTGVGRVSFPPKRKSTGGNPYNQ